MFRRCALRAWSFQTRRVVIYLPMIPEAVAAMLACARMIPTYCMRYGQSCGLDDLRSTRAESHL